MENSEKVVTFNVNLCGCHSDCNCSCGEVQPPEQKPEEGQECQCAQPGVRTVTVGEGGDFSTLRKALEHVRTIACNAVNINLVSDVTEEGDGTIVIDSFHGHASIRLNGNGHRLDISCITKHDGIGVYSHASMWMTNIEIYAPNVENTAIAGSTDSFLAFGVDVKIITVKKIGVSIYYGSFLKLESSGITFDGCSTAILAGFNSQAAIMRQPTFTNVTTPFSPARDTLGNKNSFIAVKY